MQLRITLKKCMKAKGLNFKTLAALSNQKVTTIQDWAKGSAPRDLNGVREVAKVLGVSFEFLIFGSEAPIPESVEQMLNSLPTQIIHSGWTKITLEVPRKDATTKIKKE